MAGAATTVTAQLTFPGLKAGSVLVATMTTYAGDSHRVIARSVVRLGEDGPAVVQLAAPVEANDQVQVKAVVGNRSCTVNLLPDELDGAAPLVDCTNR